MIIISKVLFGSVAVATLAGSVIYPGGGEEARHVAASWRGQESRELDRAGEQRASRAANHDVKPDDVKPDDMTPSHDLPHCPGRCEFFVLLSQVH